MRKLLPPFSTSFPACRETDRPQGNPGRVNVSDTAVKLWSKPIKAIKTNHLTCSRPERMFFSQKKIEFSLFGKKSCGVGSCEMFAMAGHGS